MYLKGFPKDHHLKYFTLFIFDFTLLKSIFDKEEFFQQGDWSLLIIKCLILINSILYDQVFQQG